MNARESQFLTEDEFNAEVIRIVQKHRANTATMAKEIVRLRADKRSLEEKSARQSLIAEGLREEIKTLTRRVEMYAHNLQVLVNLSDAETLDEARKDIWE